MPNQLNKNRNLKEELKEEQAARIVILAQQQAEQRERLRRRAEGLPMGVREGEHLEESNREAGRSDEDHLEETRSLFGSLTLTPRTEAREARRKEEEEAARREAQDTTATKSVQVTEGHGDHSSPLGLDSSSSSGTSSGTVPNNSGGPTLAVPSQPVTQPILQTQSTPRKVNMATNKEKLPKFHGDGKEDPRQYGQRMESSTTQNG